MGRRYRHLCPCGSPGYLHSSFRRGAGLVSPATSADSATLARVDEYWLIGEGIWADPGRGEALRSMKYQVYRRKRCSNTGGPQASNPGTTPMLEGSIRNM